MKKDTRTTVTITVSKEGRDAIRAMAQKHRWSVAQTGGILVERALEAERVSPNAQSSSSTQN